MMLFVQRNTQYIALSEYDPSKCPMILGPNDDKTDDRNSINRYLIELYNKVDNPSEALVNCWQKYQDAINVSERVLVNLGGQID